MMKYNNRLRNWFFLPGVAMLLIKCSSPAFPDEQMRIDPVLADIYKAVAAYDSIHFSDQRGKRESIIVKNRDSILTNSVGGFMDQKPYNIWKMDFEIPGYKKEPFRSDFGLFVNRDPTDNQNSFFVDLPEFYYFADSLPSPSLDTLNLNNVWISNYYRLTSNGTFGIDYAIRYLYINSQTGLLGYEMKNGDVWVNERIK